MTKDLDKKAYLDWLQREIDEIFGSSSSSKILAEGQTTNNVYNPYTAKITSLKQKIAEQLTLLQNNLNKTSQLDLKVLWTTAKSLGVAPRTMNFYFEKSKKKLLKQGLTETKKDS